MKSPVYLVVVIVQLLLSPQIHAQNEADTASINKCLSQAQLLSRNNPDSSFTLGYKALHHSKQINYTKGVAGAYNAIGYTHLVNFNKNDSATYYYNLAYQVYEAMGDFDGMGRVKFGLGYVCSFKGNLKQSKLEFEEGLEYYESAGNKQGMHNCYNTISYIHKQFQEFPEAYRNINLAIDLAKENKDTSAVADYYNSLGNLYKDQGIFSQAVDVYFEALKLWESTNDSAGMAIAYGSIGNLYYFQKDYAKALEYFQKKVPISLKAKSYWELSKTYNSIAQVYNAKNKTGTALTYFKKSLAINQKMNLPSGIVDSYLNLSSTYFLSKNYDSCKHYLTIGARMAREYQLPRVQASYLILEGKFLSAQNQKSKAIKKIEEGYTIGKERQLAFIVFEATGLLHKLYDEQHNYNKAYRFLSEYKQMQDSIQKDENIKEVTKLEMQYLFDKEKQQLEHEKEQELLLGEVKIRRQKSYIIGIIVLLFFIVLFALIYIRHSRVQAELKNIELQQRLLMVQMNPHFIFNTLSAVQNEILEKHNDVANQLLTGFAKLVRSTLDHSRKGYIKLEDEIEILETYLKLQKYRFNADFDFRVNVDDKIDVETFVIPPMFAQPFIENAIEHGLLPKNDKGTINVNYSLNGNLLKIEVEDNGVGRTSRSLVPGTKQDHISLSLKLTNERIEILKSRENKLSKFEILDLISNGKVVGTKVVIQIPFKTALN